MSIYEGPVTSLVGGNKVVTTAGTQVQLVTTSTPCAWVIISAAPANAENIVVGDANVDATADAEAGISLDAGQNIRLDVNDASMIWLDASASGEEVGYLIGAVSE
jgi:hypothetical protein